MKLQVQYGPEDVKALIQQDLQQRGYGVLLDFEVPDNCTIYLWVDDPRPAARPAPPPPAPSAPPAPAPSATAFAPAPAPAPPAPPAPADRPTGRAIVTKWSSGNARGNPLTDPIEISDLEKPRQVAIREIGTRTGLVEREFGRVDPGYAEAEAARRGEAGTAASEEKSFLDKYLTGE